MHRTLEIEYSQLQDALQDEVNAMGGNCQCFILNYLKNRNVSVFAVRKIET